MNFPRKYLNYMGINVLKNFLKRIYKRIANFIEVIDRHNIFMLAAGISFNIFLYFIPLILIAIYFAINLLDAQMVDNTIQNLFLEFLPDTENTYVIIYEVLTEISAIQKGSGTSGLIGVITTLWLSSLFISAIRSGLDRVMEVKQHKIFLFYKLKDILLTLIFPFLIILYSISIPFSAILINFFKDYIPFIKWGFVESYADEAIAITFSILLFYFMYRFIPSHARKGKFSLLAAIIGSILVFMARQIFSWYLVSMSKYGTFYGTYATIVAIALWVYYFSFIMLFSAEIANLFFPDNGDIQKKEPEKKVSQILE
ncbi:MAG: hypothetical protein A2X64_10545 [Ignavibacteria bacterium GWF2_33_9]|nr:MAG: hypothetical protein A2X64_10545 [Ignavibacteria bacterium GWF2_33_9]